MMVELFFNLLEQQTLLTVNELLRIKSLTEGKLIQNKQMIFCDVTNKSEYSNYVKVLDYLKQGNAKKLQLLINYAI